MGPSVKRAALNRDSSRATNRLKEICFPDQFQNGKFDVAKEMHELSEDMGRSTLGAPAPPTLISEDDRTSTLDLLPSISDNSAPRPLALDAGDRSTTMELIAMDLAMKPVSLSVSNRSSTIDALSLEFEDDPLIRPEGLERESTYDAVMAELQDAYPSRPSALSASSRLTTTDVLDLVTGPIPDDDPEFFVTASS